MKNIEIFDGIWDINLVRNNPNKIFVFGDNDKRNGIGGQAVIRNLSNSIGIRTKKEPLNNNESFYTDVDFDENCKKIIEDLIKIKIKSIEGNTIVFSKNGYGTGLASLKEKAPNTFNYLCDLLKSFFHFDNERGCKWQKLPSHNEIESAEYLKYNKQNEDLIIPVNNSLFLDHILESGITNYFDLIKSEKKVAITSKISYKKDQILLLSFPGQKSYLVVKVLIDSYDILDINDWSSLEGFKYDFITMDISKYKQTIFSYICQLNENGQMILREEIFSNEIPKIETEKFSDNDNNIFVQILNELKEINKKLYNLNK